MASMKKNTPKVGQGASAFVGGLMFVLIFSGMGGMGDIESSPPPITGECSDGVDNDLDGGVDYNGIPTHDNECRYSGADSGFITYNCINWGSETVPPMTFIECMS